MSITSIFILFQFVCRGKIPKVDFLTDSNGKVITGNNFGLSVFTGTAFLPEPLRPGPLWQLDNKTPFPEELGLYFNKPSHGIIAPTQPVTPSTVQNMLRCLHWRKIQSRQSGALQWYAHTRPNFVLQWRLNIGLTKLFDMSCVNVFIHPLKEKVGHVVIFLNLNKKLFKNTLLF